MTNIIVKIKVSWWGTIYLKLLAWLAYATCQTPDMDKVAATVMRGVKVSK